MVLGLVFRVYFFGGCEDCSVTMHFAHGYFVVVMGCEAGMDFGLCFMGSLSAVTTA